MSMNHNHTHEAGAHVLASSTRGAVMTETPSHNNDSGLETLRELHAADLLRFHPRNGCRTCGSTSDVVDPCPTIAALEES